MQRSNSFRIYESRKLLLFTSITNKRNCQGEQDESAEELQRKGTAKK